MSNNQDNTQVSQSLKVIAQYLKDLSFENPGQGFLSRLHCTNPEININIQVHTNQNTENPEQYLVDITLKAIKDTPLFIIDTTYTGIFELIGFNDITKEQMVNIQCPAILFPFIRRIIGEKTIDGGYPPLYLDPIDFHAIYMQKLSHQELLNNTDYKSVVN